MRILMVNKYYRSFGGTERYISEVTDLLERAGHEVIPFAMADPRNEPTPYAEHFVSPVDFFGSNRWRSAGRIARRVVYSREGYEKISELVRVVRPDVAHVHNIYHQLSPSVLVALHRARVPVLMTLHDYKLICPAYSLWVDGRTCERCNGARYYQCAVHRCIHGSLAGSLLGSVEAYTHRLLRTYASVGMFVSPSRFSRSKHIAHGVSPARIGYLPNPLALDRYEPCYAHDNYFAYVGRLVPFKGVGTLLQAMALLRTPTPLLVTGDGPLRMELEAKARALGLDQVSFVGHLGGRALQDLVARAKFVVVPSEWYENCPYAVLEAMALGTPVVGAAIGGIPELVDHGVNGLLFRAGQTGALAVQIARLLQGDAAVLSEMGKAGRARIESVHGDATHRDALLDLYAEIGANASHPSS